MLARGDATGVAQLERQNATAANASVRRGTSDSLLGADRRAIVMSRVRSRQIQGLGAGKLVALQQSCADNEKMKCIASAALAFGLFVTLISAHHSYSAENDLAEIKTESRSGMMRR